MPECPQLSMVAQLLPDFYVRKTLQTTNSGKSNHTKCNYA